MSAQMIQSGMLAESASGSLITLSRRRPALSHGGTGPVEEAAAT